MKTAPLISLPLAILLLRLSVIAAPGDLDLTFGGTGKVTTAIGSNSGGNCVKIQNDGKIVVVGYSETMIAVARYKSDGSLDESFGGTGTITTPVRSGAEAKSVAIQSDGKIVVAGRTEYPRDFVVARYNADGSLDTSFGGIGIVITAFGTNSYSTRCGFAKRRENTRRR